MSHTNTVLDTPIFLQRGGEMGALTRAYDWASTPLGPPSQWPHSLRTTVNIVLNSRFPMFLWWGPDLIQFYNDAYRPSLGHNGKHPMAFGQRGEECWPEIWPIIKPLLDQVQAGGEATWSEDQLIPFYRNGRIEDIYWTFSYSPVYGESGEVAGILTVCQETTRQVITQRQLNLSETRFRRLIEQAPVATCMFVGRDLQIEVANEVMLAYWGKDRTILGKPLREGVPELVGQPFLGILDQVFTSGETYKAQNMPVELQVDGELGTYYFDFTYKPLFDGTGEVYAIMNMAEDVTEQVLSGIRLKESEERYRKLALELEQQVLHRTQELATLNETLETTNKQLTESNNLLQSSNEHLAVFAYAASHDLQEPLRKIQQFSNMLKVNYKPSSYDEILYLDRMQAAAQRMSVLIEDLLSFSRLSSQQRHSVATPLNEVIETVMLDLELRIAESGAQITVAPLPTVSGDPAQLGQLFLNLLTNAIKFTVPGKVPAILVAAHGVAADQLPPGISPGRPSDMYHRIDVQDNGIGFEEKYLGRIFQVFQRLHGRSEYPGTGIGLAICERVVQNHGGAITARSQPGKGATFSVYLPG